jgi:hypothetical protein
MTAEKAMMEPFATPRECCSRHRRRRGGLRHPLFSDDNAKFY